MPTSFSIGLKITSTTVLLVLASIGSVVAQPNIIHISADDLGWTDLSSNLTNLGNGSQFYQTPNIDQLAQGGLSFTSAYAMPSCVPSRMAIMTGQSGTRTRTYAAGSIAGNANDPLVPPADNISTISNTTQTLGETLQQSGYSTAHIGKFHVTRNEQSITSEHGFDVNIGGGTSGGPGSYFAAQGNRQWTYSNSVAATMDPYAEPYSATYVAENIQPYANGADPNSLVGTAKHLTDATADAAIDYIQGQLGSDEPFYMNLAFHSVHVPVQPRPDLLAKYEGIIRANGGQSPDSRHNNAEFAALLEGMDQAVGRLMSFLDDPDADPTTKDSIASDTLIVFYGDNGGTTRETNNSPLSLGKGNLSEGGIRVPLIAYQPGAIEAGVTDELIQPVDFFPTFTELAGGTLPNAAQQPLDGVSLTGVLSGEKLDRSMVHFHLPGYANNTDPSSASVVDAGNGQFKLHYQYDDRSIQIYDLSKDLGEENNLVAASMTARTYKIGAKTIVGLRDFLDDADAQYPSTRDGDVVPAPSYLPTVELSIAENGGDNLGIAATTETTDQGTLLSFDQDVVLKSLSLNRASLDGGANTSVTLSFADGSNPFLELDGYDDNSFQVRDDSLSISGTASQLTDLQFGILAQNEIFLSAGTRLLLSQGSGDALEVDSISVAQPLSSLDRILLDVQLDGEINGDDIDSLCNAVGNDALSIEYDQNGDAVVSFADVETWLAANQTLNGDTNLDGEVSFSDFLQLSENFGTEARWSQGDFDCSGEVSFADFLTLSDAFGQSFSASVSTVPEPTMPWGMIIAWLVFMAIRRRNAPVFVTR